MNNRRKRRKRKKKLTVLVTKKGKMWLPAYRRGEYGHTRTTTSEIEGLKDRYDVSFKHEK